MPMTQLAKSSDVAPQRALVHVQGLQKDAPCRDMVPFSSSGLTRMMCPELLRGSAKDCSVFPFPPGHAQPPATGRKYTVVFRKTQHLNPHYSKGRD